MDDNTFKFNEHQFKKVGMAEAFTPRVILQMEKREPSIVHPFEKTYENGDRINVLLHLKKSTTGENYFLNKFDAELLKNGQANPIAQSFYLNQRPLNRMDEQGQFIKGENKYTLKEAYNLLAGRPVYKTLISREGEAYDAWIKLNTKNKLENGNYELKQFTKGYGFDLEATLKNYPIRELENELYKKSLIESLQRGNLQKVTFVAGDKEEKLYVSPNISTRSLDLRTLEGKRLSTNELSERNFISAALAARLSEKMPQPIKQEQTTDGQKLAQEARPIVGIQKPSQKVKKEKPEEEGGVQKPRNKIKM